MSASASNIMITAPAATIHDIPPEILIRICSFNTYQYWSFFPENDISSKFTLLPAILDTIRASHVCRRWRNVLTLAPDLWVNIDLRSLEGAHVMLKRSHVCGIKIVVPTAGRHRYERVISLPETRNRLVELHLTDNYDSLPWGDTIPGSFPRLRYLYMDIQRLPDDFPGLATPALEHLYLQGAFTHEFHRFDTFSNTLTHLTVANPRHRMQPQQLIALTDQLHNLRGLTLRGALSLPSSMTIPSTLKQIRVHDFSLTDEREVVSQFFHHAELTPSLKSISLDSHSDRGQSKNLEHILSKAVDAFNIVCSSGVFERCKLHIGLGEVAYAGLPDSKPSGRQPEEHKFHVHLAYVFSFDKLVSAFLPLWLYDRVEYLTINFPVFDPLFGELGEEIVVEMLRRFSNVQVLDGVGSVLWSLLYRWSQPLDGDDRLPLPSLRKIVLHYDCLPTTLDTNDDVCLPRSDVVEEEEEEEEEGNGEGGDELGGRWNIATAVLVPPVELFPDSDSDDSSFVPKLSHSNFSDSEGSTSPTGPLEGEQQGVHDYSKEYIDTREIITFCLNRSLIRNFIISSSADQDDRCHNDLRLALGEIGVHLETRNDSTNR